MTTRMNLSEFRRQTTEDNLVVCMRREKVSAFSLFYCGI